MICRTGKALQPRIPLIRVVFWVMGSSRPSAHLLISLAIFFPCPLVAVPRPVHPQPWKKWKLCIGQRRRRPSPTITSGKTLLTFLLGHMDSAPQFFSYVLPGFLKVSYSGPDKEHRRKKDFWYYIVRLAELVYPLASWTSHFIPNILGYTPQIYKVLHFLCKSFQMKWNISLFPSQHPPFLPSLLSFLPLFMKIFLCLSPAHTSRKMSDGLVGLFPYSE